MKHKITAGKVRDLRNNLPCCREFDILENGKKIGYAFDNEHTDGWTVVIAGVYAIRSMGNCGKERVLAKVRDYIAWGDRIVARQDSQTIKEVSDES